MLGALFPFDCRTALKSALFFLVPYLQAGTGPERRCWSSISPNGAVVPFFPLALAAPCAAVKVAVVVERLCQGCL